MPVYCPPLDGVPISIGLGCSELVEIRGAGQFVGEEGRSVETRDEAHIFGDEDSVGRMSREDEGVGVCDASWPSPLNTYVPTSGCESGYSDWFIQCANEIYPIVGISYVGH